MLERLDVPTIRDARGNLSFLEGGIHVPFDIARVYYLHDVPFGAERGGHAHRQLQQAIVALAGRFVCRLFDGRTWVEHELMDPTQALLVPRMTWRELYGFSSGAVCLVLASRPYEEGDYIRDVEEFTRETAG